MRSLYLFLITLLPAVVWAQQERDFKQHVDFVIEADLDVAHKSLDGNIEMTYTNHSTDTLPFIWMHVWPNAFKNDKTSFSEQMLQDRKTDFYFSNEDARGYINRMNFEVDGVVAQLEDHPLYIDVVKVILPEPLLPGKSVVIRSPFHVKISELFTDLGYKDQVFFLSNWYPQPAIYDANGKFLVPFWVKRKVDLIFTDTLPENGWHPMPYQYGKGHFNQMGDYRVTIHVPNGWKVIGTGEPQDVSPEGEKQIFHFEQKSISGFSFVAAKNLKRSNTNIGNLNVSFLLRKGTAKNIDQLNTMAETSLDFWKKKLGDFPFENLNVVQLPVSADNRASYPDMIVLPESATTEEYDQLIFEGIGRQYLEHAIQVNARDSSWISDGIIGLYWEQFSNEKQKRDLSESQSFFEKRMPQDRDRFAYLNAVADQKDPFLYSRDNLYRSREVSSYKAGEAMKRLQEVVGNEVFDSNIKTYYERSKNGLRNSFTNLFDIKPAPLSNTTVQNSFFDLFDIERAPLSNTTVLNEIFRQGEIGKQNKKQTKVAGFFNLNNEPDKQYVFVSPAIGFNNYDKLMLGGLIHNYTLPEPKFHFLLAPMYGTSSKRFTGMARVGYSIKTFGRRIPKVDIDLAAARFDKDEFTNQEGVKNFMFVEKLVPTITWHIKDFRPEVTNVILWKTYLFNEEEIRFRLDASGEKYQDYYPQYKRYLNQLSFSHINDRELYPFDYTVQAQQAKGFGRLTLEAHQLFNYPKGGGLEVRLFGGKLFEIGEGNAFTSRYQLNMTGPNGNEDYTYSDYFIGRNEFSGWMTQQIMMRDGGFKVRTDLLNRKVGVSADWLAAVNLTTDLPKGMNPTPIHSDWISLKAFADIGTYAEAWERNPNTGRFLFDAGLQLDLLKDLVKIYVPIVYSKAYGDYYKSTVPKDKRFWQKISFSIDIGRFNLKKFLNLPR